MSIVRLGGYSSLAVSQSQSMMGPIWYFGKAKNSIIIPEFYYICVARVVIISTKKSRRRRGWWLVAVEFLGGLIKVWCVRGIRGRRHTLVSKHFYVTFVAQFRFISCFFAGFNFELHTDLSVDGVCAKSNNWLAGVYFPFVFSPLTNT